MNLRGSFLRQVLTPITGQPLGPGGNILDLRLRKNASAARKKAQPQSKAAVSAIVRGLIENQLFIEFNVFKCPAETYELLQANAATNQVAKERSMMYGRLYMFHIAEAASQIPRAGCQGFQIYV